MTLVLSIVGITKLVHQLVTSLNSVSVYCILKGKGLSQSIKTPLLRFVIQERRKEREYSTHCSPNLEVINVRMNWVEILSGK